ncbi:galactose mutarotase [Gilvimarinus agarilyticus]|uniref:aldose epimerase family protein n=1 Tax=Gilvimarinus sp. 2_MG-2023 TaxID=3062666 RepID=UPI001C084521|nr:aldose epimerase family protein [Gilvimarinus sp. 2_MG-2023]MBU2886391.1 galactose mutarotase [Gilvimarinus agarilyticus]MDO6571070.1 aldose epimerase family protein [Gilvimarinus sp. 2_MG-2023]
MRKTLYGHLPCGSAVYEYTLRNSQNIAVTIIDYGATITGIYVPDEQGNNINLVLGYDNLEGYLKGSSYLGAVVGRVANRIDAGVFELGGKRYQLDVNNGPNHLHGGNDGYDKKLWQGRFCEQESSQQLRLTLVSEDGDQGYPGELTLEVVYSLTEDNELRIEYSAGCEKAATPVNLTQHSYFNLQGVSGGDINGHELTLFADSYTPINSTGIPTGTLLPMGGSSLDFSYTRSLGEVVTSGAPEVVAAGGVDHNFVVRREAPNDLAKVALLRDPDTGRAMEVFSTQPGVQVYTANYLQDDAAASLQSFPRYGAVCLECQGFPDAVNQPGFPSVVVQPGEQYRETTCYRFLV